MRLSVVIGSAFFIVIFSFFASIIFAQDWEPIGAESFQALTDIDDGGLLMLRYPGDILRSTDTGATWSVVYEGRARLAGFDYPSPNLSPLGERSVVVAYGDSGYAVVSSDSGRTWQEEVPGQPPTNPRPQSSGRQALVKSGEPEGDVYAFLDPLPTGTNAVSFADSAYWAVGEPGLIFRWDLATKRWNEIHRAPYADQPFGNDIADTTGATIDFRNPSYGALSLGDTLFITEDSGVTWRASVLPDPSPISSFFFVSDTETLAATWDGKVFVSGNDRVWRECDSILYQNQNPLLFKEGAGGGPPPILHIGWEDANAGQLYLLTDSELFTVSADLAVATSAPLPLHSGEYATHASFPNPYVGFFLSDSVTRFDTLTGDGRDTTIVHDTSVIYRSLDGGGTWTAALKNIPGLTSLIFTNVREGFACGMNGIIMMTNDSGSTWSRSNARTKQTLRDIRFVNDSVGYAVGDSGTVLVTYNSGRFWRALPPEPLFMHPTASYTSIAFPTSHTVAIVSRRRGFHSAIKIPASWQMPRRRQTRASLSVSVRPDPVSGPMTFDVRFSGATPEYGAVPELKVCDLSGKSVYEVSSVEELSTSEWSAEGDLSSLSPGVYTVLASYAGQTAVTKFVKE